METAGFIIDNIIMCSFAIFSGIGAFIWGRYSVKVLALFGIAVILSFMTWIIYYGFRYVIDAIEAIGQ